MGARQHAKVVFNPQFQGEGVTDSGLKIPLGLEESQARPYDLLMIGLGTCFYATFLVLTREKKISFESVEIELSGMKRDETPTTMKTCRLEMTVTGAEDETGLKALFDLAGKNCSIYQTISHVAEMESVIIFK